MLDIIFNALKVTVIILIASVFMAAITTLVNLITALFFPGVIREVFAIMSACLPFNGAVVFNAIGNATVAILSFLIAKKIFDLTSWSVSSI